MDKKELKKYLIIGAVAVAVMVIVKNLSYIGSFISLIFTAFSPLVIGCAIAFVFNIIMSFFERHYFPKSRKKIAEKTKRPVCLLFSVCIVALGIFLISKIVVPEVAESCKVLYNTIPDIAERLKKWAIKNFENIPDIQKKISELDINWATVTENIASFLTSGATGLISSLVGIIGSFTLSITKICVGIAFAIYLLIYKDGIKKGTSRLKNAYLKKETADKLQHIFDVTNKTFKSFFVGQFTEAIILGFLCSIGMLILRLPYAVMTGTVVGVTALVPIVGAFIGAIVGAFMILTVNPMQAVIFIIFLIILQQIEEKFIYPKVVGSSIGLPGIWVLASITVGGAMSGILGMLLGVPTVAVIYKLVCENLEKRESEKKKQTSAPKPDNNNSGKK
ncbi:MAG TPA: AI-2E family transporter [Ruminococcus sp.]|nr:AI-2E family transporter [Ruminococcus sp.]